MQAWGPGAIDAKAGRVGRARRRTARIARAAVLQLMPILVVASPNPAAGQGPACTKMQFEAVVGEAASALRDLNAQNRPAFQVKLRALKDKRGWSHDQFLKEAAPLVQDDKSAEYDRQSGDYLTRIQSMGAEGAAAKEPDCSQLGQLKSHMQALVESQKAKWQYLLGKIEQELAK
jgi:hypothetical protein